MVGWIASCYLLFDWASVTNRLKMKLRLSDQMQPPFNQALRVVICKPVECGLNTADFFDRWSRIVVEFSCALMRRCRLFCGWNIQLECGRRRNYWYECAGLFPATKRHVNNVALRFVVKNMGVVGCVNRDAIVLLELTAHLLSTSHTCFTTINKYSNYHRPVRR